VVRIDLDATRLQTNPDQGIAIEGDARNLLTAITQRLPTAAPSCVLARADHAAHSAVSRFDGAGDADCLVKPQALFSALSRGAADIPVCADAGNAMCWAIEWLARDRPGDFQVSLDWGTMGFALPAAIGISLARGKKPVIAVTGDGSMAMAGGDLHTAVELELPLILVVLNDGGAGMVRAGSRAWFGPDAVPNPDYRYKINLAAYARGFGAHAELVTCAARFEAQLKQALARPTPTLFDVQIDPDEVPAAVRQRIKGLTAVDDATLRPGGGMC
jgi:acetolactate synthase-1/2/3 large subunit